MATRREIRRSIGNFRHRGRRLLEVFGTATAATSTTLDLAELDFYSDQSADEFDGYGLSSVGGVGAGTEARVSTFTAANDRVTFTPSYATFDTTSIIELWQSDLNATRVNDAINRAIDLIRNEVLVPISATLYAYEGSRTEYPIPDNFVKLYGVYALKVGADTQVAAAEADTFRALYDAAARTRLAQGFKPTTTGLYRGLVLWLRKQGTIGTERTLTCVVDNDSSGAPNTASTITGTSTTVGTDDIFTETAPLFFDWGRPVQLVAGTQYWADLSISGNADSTNHIQWAEDDDNVYADGSLQTYNGSAWTNVSGSDMVFSLVKWSDDWVELLGSDWDVTRRSTTRGTLELLGDAKRPLPTDFGVTLTMTEGTPLRFLGLRRAARPTVDTDELEGPRAFIELEALATVMEWIGVEPTIAAGYHELAAKELGRHLVKPILPPNTRDVLWQM